MKPINKIAIFSGQQIRRHWDENKELWYFAIMDIYNSLGILHTF